MTKEEALKILLNSNWEILSEETYSRLKEVLASVEKDQYWNSSNSWYDSSCTWVESEL